MGFSIQDFNGLLKEAFEVHSYRIKNIRDAE